MDNTKLENIILQTIDILTSKKIANAGYDKTVKATVLSTVDATIGKYKVKYQDSVWFAYSNNTDVSYSNGTSVYVLVPGGDLSRDKTILGTTEKLGINYITLAQEINKYYPVGKNVILSGGQGDLNSYIDNDVIVLYDKTSNNNPISLDVNGIEEYLKNSDYFALKAKIKTALPTQQQYNGDYGILVTLDYANNVTKSYMINIDSILGNPYKLIDYTNQYEIFEIDKENFVGINQISIFSQDFPHQANNKPDDIFIHDLEIQGLNRIPNQNLDTCALVLNAPQGTIFASADASSRTIRLEAEVRVKGQIVNLQFQQLPFYWFVENTNITTNSDKYCKYGGQGWECLNDVNQLVVQGVTVYETAPAANVLSITKSDVLTKKKKYKCVVLYDDVSFSREVTITNLGANYDITIVSNKGTEFYLDSENPVLTCKVYNGSGTDISNNSSLSFVWGKTDYKEMFSSISQGQNRNQLNVNVQEITNYITYKCSVFTNNGVDYIGTASIVLVHNGTAKEKTYSLIINNGVQVFKYNTLGISPASDVNKRPYNIPALTFTLFDPQGNEVNSQALASADITWSVPVDDTMLKVTDYTPDNYTQGDEKYIFKNLTELAYHIATSFNAAKGDNEIQLKVVYQGQTFIAKTNFVFIKEGAAGTNGTDYFCRVIPNTLDGVIPYYPSLTYDGSSLTYNWTNTGNPSFKVELWHNGEIIFSGNLDGTQDTNTSEQGKEVKITWDILRNRYGRQSGSIIQDKSDLAYAGPGANGTFTLDSSSPLRGTTISNYTSYHPANIIKATIEYDGYTMYGYLPLITFRKFNNNNYNFKLKEYTGFNEVLYNEAGLLPAYDTHEPFTIENQLTATNFTCTWRRHGSIWERVNSAWTEKKETDQTSIWSKTLPTQVEYNQYKIQPIDLYDGQCVTVGISCQVKVSNTTVYWMHVPIHYLRNRYFNSALNAWDGNSVQLGQDGGMILAPQVGAGQKDDQNRFTGLFMGTAKDPGVDLSADKIIGGTNYDVGLFGYHEGDRTIFLDAKTGKAEFGKSGAGQIILDPTQNQAVIRSGNYVSGTSGMQINLTAPSIVYGNGNFSVDSNGNINAQSGTISGAIVSSGINANNITTGVIQSDDSNDPNFRFNLNTGQMHIKQLETIADSVDTVSRNAVTGDLLHYLATSYSSGVQNTNGAWGTWSTTVQQMTSTNKYLWIYHTYTKGNGSTTNTNPVIYGVYGQTGQQGPTGPSGAQGVGIKNVVPLHYASASRTNAPTGPSAHVTSSSIAANQWTKTIPTLSSSIPYIWVCDQIEYTDNTQANPHYSWTDVILDENLSGLIITVSEHTTKFTQTDAAIAARALQTDLQAEVNKTDGLIGVNGTITNRVSSLQTTATNITATVQSMQNQIDSAIETFSGSVQPTLSNEPAVNWDTDSEKAQHLGDLYIVNSSGGNKAGFYYRFELNNNTYGWVLLKDSQVTLALSQLSQIDAGAIVEDKLYYLATSANTGVTRDTSIWNWTDDITQATLTSTNKYLWVYHRYTRGITGTSTYSYTDPIIYGTWGHGVNTATVQLFRRFATQPSNWSTYKPNTQLTYDFSDHTLTPTSGLNSWSLTIPSGTNPCYTIVATAYGTEDTEVIEANEWSVPIKMDGTDGTNGINGLDGYNTATVFLYQRKSSQPSVPTGDYTYKFSTGTLSPNPNNNWSIGMPAFTNNPCWSISMTFYSRDDEQTKNSSGWTTPIKLVENGAQGAQGVSITGDVPIYYLSTSNTTTPTSPSAVVTLEEGYNSQGQWQYRPGQWILNIPRYNPDNQNFKYLWIAHQITYSDGNHTWTTAYLDNNPINLNARLNTAEQKITDSAITQTVLSAQSFQQVLPGINLIPSIYDTQANQIGANKFTIAGIDWTVNNDGSITAKPVTAGATRSNDSIFYIIQPRTTKSSTSTEPALVPPIKLDKTKFYILSGCPATGSSSTYYMGIRLWKGNNPPDDATDSTTFITCYDYGSGAIPTTTQFTNADGFGYAGIWITIKASYNIAAAGLTFYPMLNQGKIAKPYQNNHYNKNINVGIIKSVSQIEQTAEAISLKVDSGITIQNLLPILYETPAQQQLQNRRQITISGITWTLNDDNSITAKGTATGTGSTYRLASQADGYKVAPIPLNKYLRYSLSGCPSGGSTNYYIRARLWRSNDTSVDITDSGSGIISPVVQEDGSDGFIKASIWIYIKNGYTTPSAGLTFKPMFEVGTEKHDYLPSNGAEQYLENQSQIIQTKDSITSRVDAVEKGIKIDNLLPSVPAMYEMRKNYGQNTNDGYKITYNGVTWTVLSNGKIRVNGTPTSGNAVFYINNYSDGSDGSPGATAYFNINPNLKYRLYGCPSGGTSGNTERYVLRARCADATHTIYSPQAYANDTGTGVIINSNNQKYDKLCVYIIIFNGYTANNLQFAPMLTVGTETYKYIPPFETVTSAYSQIQQTANSITSTVSAIETSTHTTSGGSVINLVPPYFNTQGTGGVRKTQTYNGLTWAVGDDGKLTVTGTATTTSIYNITGWYAKQQIPCISLSGSKSYILTGCPPGGSDTTFDLRARFKHYNGTDPNFDDPNGESGNNEDLKNNGNLYKDQGSGVTIPYDNNGTPRNYTHAYIYVRVYQGQPGSGNSIVFSPMLQEGSTAHTYTSTHTLSSVITQNADNINLKVSKDNIISEINQSPEAITINASKINLQGAVTIQSLDNSLKGQVNKSIKSSIQLWYASNSNETPSKPTSQVSSTSTSGGAWRTVVPTWNSNNPYYFYCFQYLLSDGSYDWSTVKMDNAVNNALTTAASASSAASVAQNTANAALQDTHLVYIKAPSGVTSLSSYTSVLALLNTWITNTTPTNISATSPKWGIKRPAYDSSYPVLFVAIQNKTKGGTVSYTTPLVDDTITIIDGGHITTGKIDAARISVTDLNAFSATIGGWSIGDNQISNTRSGVSETVDGTDYSVDYKAFLYCPSNAAFTPSSNSAFAIKRDATPSGSSTATTTYPFRVTYDGSLTSTKGQIGGWTIEDTRIKKERTISGTLYRACLYSPASPSTSNSAFYIGKSTDNGASWEYPVKITYGGTLNATSANITGGTVQMTTSTNTYDSISLSYSNFKTALTPLQLVAWNSSTKYRAVLQAGGIFFAKNCSTISDSGTGLSTLQGGGLYLKDDEASIKAFLGPSNGDGVLYLYDKDANLRANLNDGGLYLYGLGGTSVEYTHYGQHAIDFMPPPSSVNSTAYNTGGWIDFHYQRSTSDYTSRLIGSSNTTTALPSITNGSDRRMKEDIEALTEEKYIFLLQNLNPVKYKYKFFEGKHYGFIAQDVVKVCKELNIDYSGLIDKSAMYAPEDSTEYMTLNYIDLIAILVKGYQDLNTKFNALVAQLQK